MKILLLASLSIVVAGRRGALGAREQPRSPTTASPRTTSSWNGSTGSSFKNGWRRTRRSNTPSSTPGRRPAALARRTSRTWSRCIGSTPSKGLAVISLSLDDPTDKAAVAEAEKFLKEKKAVFTNVLLDEELRRRIREAEHQRDPRGIRLRARRQGGETIHHGRSQQPVHLRRSRKGGRRPARREIVSSVVDEFERTFCSS